VDAPYRQPANDVSGIVRSIRIGAALNDQFGELLRRKIYNNPDRLESLIGEVGQLYPEIWANFDHARKALVERGLSVDAYDALRATPAACSGGVLDVELAGHGLGEHALSKGRRDKTAYLNTRGHATATEACNVLRRALPDVDWEELDRADAAELAEIGSLGPSKAKKLLVYGVAAMAALVAAILLVVFWVHVKTR
jgi:hypothetical protein